MDAIELHGPILEGPETWVRRPGEVERCGHAEGIWAGSHPTSRSLVTVRTGTARAGPRAIRRRQHHLARRAKPGNRDRVLHVLRQQHRQDAGSSKRSPAHDSHARGAWASASNRRRSPPARRARSPPGGVHRYTALQPCPAARALHRRGPRPAERDLGDPERGARIARSTQHPQRVQAGLESRRRKLLQPGFAHVLTSASTEDAVRLIAADRPVVTSAPPPPSNGHVAVPSTRTCTSASRRRRGAVPRTATGGRAATADRGCARAPRWASVSSSDAG